jgi:hypothetical protein
MTTTSPTSRRASTPPYRDRPVDVKIVLSGLWTAMLFVFAYVDIFAYLRADVLESALDGEVATTGFHVDQMFLTLTLAYILVPALMVVGSLVLRPRTNRLLNLVVSGVYAITIIGSAVGETWAYYIIGSVVEVLLLVAVARTAWTWPREEAPPAEGP